MAESAESFLHLLYTTQYAKLVKAAYRMAGSMESAQDLVQQVFLLALVREKDLALHPLPEGWLMLTLHNLVKNERRRRESHPEAPLDDVAGSAGQEPPGSVEDILPRELSPEDREILIWRYGRQMAYREIADRLGISEAGCRSRVSRALANCRKYLKKI